MHTFLSARPIAAAIVLTLAGLFLGVAAAGAIESEGETFVRTRLVGNLGVASTSVGVYPDRGPNPAPERSDATAELTIPSGAEIVQTIVVWAGRGPGWSDPEISIDGEAIAPDADYSWTWPGYTQVTYVADLGPAGLDLVSGTNVLDISGLDHDGGRFYGVGVLAIYSHPELPEVELEVLEGNEFAFKGETFFDDVGHGGTHSSTVCSDFAPALEDRPLMVSARVMGIDAGRNDGPPRSQRYEWWTTTGPVVAPIENGLVGIPSEPAEGAIDNPVTPRVPATGEWGAETFTTSEPVLGAGETHFCAQLQSVDIGDGIGASLSLSDHTVTAGAIYRLGNLVWLDENDNGAADLGEPGIDGVTVELRRVGDDEPIATTVTDDDGAYLFEGLVCGTYVVSIPGDQTDWTVAGEAVDELEAGAIVSSDPDDDADNDNNGVPSTGGVVSGPITIGDCGEDGDFSNGASSEPTDETDRVGGPDDDPDDLSPAEGNYDDVRSNTSIDFAFVPAAAGVDVDVDGDVECADDPDANIEPGESCDPDDADDPDEPTTQDSSQEPGDAPDGNDPDDPPTDDPDTTTEPDPGTTPNEPEDPEDVEVEVEGEVEINEQQQSDPEDLAVTGSSSVPIALGATMLLVLGIWLSVAGLWMRPTR